MPGARSGPRRFGRALSWVATLTSLLVLAGSGASYLYVNAQFDSIKSIGGLCLKNCKGAPTELGRTENFLLVGTDSRAGANTAGDLSGLREKGGAGAYGNSDTTLLVHISADTQKVIIVSFPRDMLVQLPAYTNADGTPGIDSGKGVKFNEAYSVGGPELLIEQIESLTHLPVDHFLSIDFAGFQSMVDALGGIQVCLSVPADDPGAPGTGGSGFHATKGVHKLDGAQALMYVRQRDGLAGADLGRIGRQQRFLADVIAKARQPSTLANPIKLNNFITAITSNITKDSKTTQGDLFGLVQKLRNLDPSRVEFNTVPTLPNVLGSIGDYLPIDRPKAQALFQAIYDNQDPADPPKPSSSATPAGRTAAATNLTVAPSAITVAVANGSGLDGKGAMTAKLLQAQGFHVSSIITATRSDTSSTVISYGSDRVDSAKTLAAAIPGSVLMPTTAGTETLTLTVGTTFTDVNPVTVGSVTPSAPTASPTTPAPTPSAPASKAPVVTAAGTNCGP